MTSEAVQLENETANGTVHDEQLSFDSNQIASDDQLSEIIDSINLTTTTTTNEETTKDEAQAKATPTRTVGQTEIGAKLVKKLETLGKLL